MAPPSRPKLRRPWWPASGHHRSTLPGSWDVESSGKSVESGWAISLQGDPSVSTPSNGGANTNQHMSCNQLNGQKYPQTTTRREKHNQPDQPPRYTSGSPLLEAPDAGTVITAFLTLVFKKFSASCCSFLALKKGSPKKGFWLRAVDLFGAFLEFFLGAFWDASKVLLKRCV